MLIKDRGGKKTNNEANLNGNGNKNSSYAVIFLLPNNRSNLHVLHIFTKGDKQRMCMGECCDHTNNKSIEWHKARP